jgi:hypothetical protein
VAARALTIQPRGRLLGAGFLGAPPLFITLPLGRPGLDAEAGAEPGGRLRLRHHPLQDPRLRGPVEQLAITTKLCK